MLFQKTHEKIKVIILHLGSSYDVVGNLVDY